MKIYHKELELPEDIHINMPYARSKFVKVYVKVEKGDELNLVGYSVDLTLELPGKYILIDVDPPYFMEGDKKKIKEYIEKLKTDKM